ncbi:lysophospholipase, partial [bacterium]|nr:lysophospholipase [bacterium]
MKTKKEVPRGVIIMTHGLRVYGMVYRDFIEALLLAGYDVVIWNLPGHGGMRNEPIVVIDYKLYARAWVAVFNRYYERIPSAMPIGVIGWSVGASAAVFGVAYLAEKYPHIFERISCTVGIGAAFRVAHRYNVGCALAFLGPFLAPLLPAFFAMWKSLAGYLIGGGCEPEKWHHDGDVQAYLQGRSAFINTAPRACSKTLDYCEFMLRAANGGSERLKISTIFFAF